MGQFSVHRNPNPRSRESTPYLLDVQSDLLAALATRVVVPLVPAAPAGAAAERLNPVFSVEGVEVVMSTAELAGIPRAAIGEEIASLATHRDDIAGALDFLVTGI